MNLIQKYQRLLEQAKWKASAVQWIVLSLLIGIGIGVMSFALIEMFDLPVSPLIAIVVGFTCFDAVIAWPYLKALKRIQSIEENMPDAFKQISDTLKAGGTFEYALRGIATAEYGALTEEMNGVLRKISEGENLENSLRGFAEKIDSKLVKRSVNIIIDSVQSGAGLADVLDKIADDIRAIYRINQERKTTTLMQVLFLIAAGAVVAPLVFGMVSSIVGFLIKAIVTGTKLSAAETAAAMATRELIMLLMQLYIAVEAIATSAMIALMREGKASKALLYAPILLLIAYAIYYLALFAVNGMLGGV